MKKKMVETIEWEIGDEVKIDNTEQDEAAGASGTIKLIGWVNGEHRAIVKFAPNGYYSVSPNRLYPAEIAA